MNIYSQYIVSISSPSKYLNWYISIISNSIFRQQSLSRTKLKSLIGYIEGHHILPRCLCLNETQISDKNNIAYLTAREHFICHWLLTKIFNENYRLFYALSRMSLEQHGLRKLTSKQYEICKKANSIASSLKTPWNKGRAGDEKLKTGPCPNSRKLSISNSRKNTIKQECPHCLKSIDPGNYRKYHGDNCKQNPNINPQILIDRSNKQREQVLKSIEAGTHKHRTPTSFGIITCPHCGKEGTNIGPMKRFHFSNCYTITGVKHKSLPLVKCSCMMCKKELNIASFAKHRCE